MAYSEKRDGTGLQARVSAAYHKGEVTITRADTLANTEAGAGKSDLTNWAIAGELGYGVALADHMVATPYIGLRYGAADRSAYTEGTSETVQFPITYDAYTDKPTTNITFGLEIGF